MKVKAFCLSRLRRDGTTAYRALLPTVFGLALMLTACASAPYGENTTGSPAESEQALVWPGPPSTPIIRYVGELRTDNDFQRSRKTSWKDSLLGEAEQLVKGVKTPYGVYADQFGRLIVADTGLAGLPVFDFTNQRFDFFGSNGPGAITKAFGVAGDRFGRLYVTDGGARRVLVFDQGGKYLYDIGRDGDFERPVGIAVDSARERVYVGDALKHHVVVYDFEGNRVATIGERGSALMKFNFPLNLAVDSSGRLYVCDSMNFRIQVIEPDGETAHAIGQQGNAPGMFNRPKGIAVDSGDRLYVVDAAFGNVQIFDPAGKLLMYFAATGTGPGALQLPAGITVSPDDQIYVADQINRRIQVFEFLGVPSDTPTPLSGKDSGD